ncbi:MAG: hypothetical protein SH868_00825 [Bythopirellula sp.]|nr:hypothetical protein [Bythopirellula sp.]
MRRCPRYFVCLYALLFLTGIASTLQAQSFTYLWDGDTNSDWSTTTNWNVFGGDPMPGLGDPLIPNNTVRVEIAVDGLGADPAPIIDTDNAVVHQIRIGRSEGPGKLTITGGSLSTGSEVGTVKARVGNGGAGTLVISGGTLNVINGTLTTGDGGDFKGQINMTGGAINITGANRDLNMDELPTGFNNAQSNINMSAGTITIADVLLVDHFASIDLSGGTITAAAEQPGAIRVRRDGEIRVTGGLLESKDDLELGNGSIPGGTIKIDGGIVRALSFSGAGAAGEIKINDDGLLQFLNMNETVAEVEAYITSGLFTTSAMSGLDVTTVDVSGMLYTQVAVAFAGVLGDFDSDGDVDGRDFLLWQRGGSPTPFSGADLATWQSNYGAPLMAVTAVPEPTCLCWLAVTTFGWIAACSRRRCV